MGPVTAFLPMKLFNLISIDNSGMREELAFKQWCLKRWGIIVFVSLQDSLQALKRAYTYLDDNYLIGIVQ